MLHLNVCHHGKNMHNKWRLMVITMHTFQMTSSMLYYIILSFGRRLVYSVQKVNCATTNEWCTAEVGSTLIFWRNTWRAFSVTESLITGHLLEQCVGQQFSLCAGFCNKSLYWPKRHAVDLIAIVSCNSVYLQAPLCL